MGNGRDLLFSVDTGKPKRSSIQTSCSFVARGLEPNIAPFLSKQPELLVSVHQPSNQTILGMHLFFWCFIARLSDTHQYHWTNVRSYTFFVSTKFHFDETISLAGLM